MDISTAGVIGAVVAIAFALFGYVSRRAYFRQQLAQFHPAEGERQRVMLRWGLKRSEHWSASSWVQLPLSIILSGFAGYMVGRLFGS